MAEKVCEHEWSWSHVKRIPDVVKVFYCTKCGAEKEEVVIDESMMHSHPMPEKTCRKPYRIYIAGPYCPRGCSTHDAARLAQRNVDKAIEVANALIEKGHYVFVPHLSHYIHIHYSCREDYGEWWYKEDNTFLTNWANAFFYIGSSKGADSELELAKNLGLKIFYRLEDVPLVPHLLR